ncbi:hypothetical protein BDV93DRAFT_551842 [Ceratobasidium sp. AG-I]|nr:hypothetical protein BDV93DRAFT_551842 [Ceratobasidium sp. AG-I]
MAWSNSASLAIPMSNSEAVTGRADAFPVFFVKSHVALGAPVPWLAYPMDEEEDSDLMRLRRLAGVWRWCTCYLRPAYLQPANQSKQPPPSLYFNTSGMYPGLFNSSYVPSPFELAYIGDPVNLLGPWFFAAIFSLMLTGVILAQTYNYVEERPKDPILVRGLIYFSFLLSVAKSGSTLSITWRMFVKDFGNYLDVGMPTIDQKITTVWGSFMGIMVQAYFIHRGFVLSNNWYFLIATSVSALIGLIGSIIFCVIVFTLKGVPPPLYLHSANMMVIGTVIADALITGFTCWYLLKQRKMTAFSGTNTLIVRLITTSMQSAVPPLICAVFNLIFNSRSHATDNAWVLLFNIILPYFYVISLMFTINSRARLRTVGGSQSDGGANVYGLRSIPKPGRMPDPEHHTQVYVSTQTRTDHINSAERGDNPAHRRSVDDASSHISVGDKKRTLGDDF